MHAIHFLFSVSDQGLRSWSSIENNRVLVGIGPGNTVVNMGTQFSKVTIRTHENGGGGSGKNFSSLQDIPQYMSSRKHVYHSGIWSGHEMMSYVFLEGQHCEPRRSLRRKRRSKSLVSSVSDFRSTLRSHGSKRHYPRLTKIPGSNSNYSESSSVNEFEIDSGISVNLHYEPTTLPLYASNQKILEERRDLVDHPRHIKRDLSQHFEEEKQHLESKWGSYVHFIVVCFPWIATKSRYHLDDIHDFPCAVLRRVHFRSFSTLRTAEIPGISHTKGISHACKRHVSVLLGEGMTKSMASIRIFLRNGIAEHYLVVNSWWLELDVVISLKGLKLWLSRSSIAAMCFCYK